MKIKKTIALLLATISLCLTLVACENKNEPTEITREETTNGFLDFPSNDDSFDKTISLTEITSTGEIPYDCFSPDSHINGITVTDTDLFEFCYNSKYGYADANGNVVIREHYDNARSFSENKAFVAVGDTWKIIDTQDNDLYTIPNNYCESLQKHISTDSYFKNGKAILAYSTTEPWEEEGYHFYNSIINALIINDDLSANEIKITTEESLSYRIINTPEFSGFITYNLDLARDYSKTGPDGYIRYSTYRLFDLSGNEIWKVSIPYINEVNGNKNPAQEYYSALQSSIKNDPTALDTFIVKNGYMNVFDKDMKWGLLNVKTGKIVIDYSYDFVGAYSNNACNVCSYGKWGYVDLQGNYTVQPAYTYTSEFTEKGALVVTEDNSVLVINNNGNTIVDSTIHLSKPSRSIYMHRFYPFTSNFDIAVIWDYDSNYKILTYDGNILLNTSISTITPPLIMTDNYIFVNKKMYKIEI